VILRTTNGGIVWSQQSGGTGNSLLDVSFSDVYNGTAVGVYGTILRTTNGGINWISQTSGTTNELSGVSFIDANHGMVVGIGGIILHTSNGGTNWIAQTSNTQDWLTSVCFTDANNVTTVGVNGTILRTTNGGITPVELTSFTAAVSYSYIQLYWSTATELNNHGFEIERSFDKTTWTTIGFREGKGTTSDPQQYSYSDNISDLSALKLYYRLKQVDFDGTFEYSKIVEVEIAPTKFSLSQNYPNPFNPSTSIQYAISNTQFVSLKVYDVLGKEVVTLVNEEKSAGNYNVEFQSTVGSLQLTSGIYYYQLRAGDFVETKKMILLK
jgi:hypothetical protein